MKQQELEYMVLLKPKYQLSQIRWLCSQYLKMNFFKQKSKEKKRKQKKHKETKQNKREIIFFYLHP